MYVWPQNQPKQENKLEMFVLFMIGYTEVNLNSQHVPYN